MCVGIRSFSEEQEDDKESPQEEAVNATRGGDV